MQSHKKQVKRKLDKKPKNSALKLKQYLSYCKKFNGNENNVMTDLKTINRTLS